MYLSLSRQLCYDLYDVDKQTKGQDMRLRDLEAWLNASDVARMKGVSRQAIHMQLNDGHYRAIKTRLGWLVDPSSVGDQGEDLTARRD
jgi:hypothetical protein